LVKLKRGNFRCEPWMDSGLTADPHEGRQFSHGAQAANKLITKLQLDRVCPAFQISGLNEAVRYGVWL